MGVDTECFQGHSCAVSKEVPTMLNLYILQKLWASFLFWQRVPRHGDAQVPWTQSTTTADTYKAPALQSMPTNIAALDMTRIITLKAMDTRCVWSQLCVTRITE